MAKNDTRVVVNMPGDLVETLGAIAAEHGGSLSGIVRHACFDWVRSRKTEQPVLLRDSKAEYRVEAHRG